MGTEWATRLKDRFDEQYYETGKTDGVSWYDNYRWMPERSRAEARAFADITGIRPCQSVVDFGCAKGFFVRAMLEAGYDAYGIDISDYAREHCDERVRGRLFAPLENNRVYQFGFVKDVLEHLDYADLDDALKGLATIARHWLLIVPLGAEAKYCIPDYELETTHIIREDFDWWVDRIGRVMELSLVAHRIAGLKDKWWPICRRGNLFLAGRSWCWKP